VEVANLHAKRLAANNTRLGTILKTAGKTNGIGTGLAAAGKLGSAVYDASK
jgi:hypothetical protein